MNILTGDCVQVMQTLPDVSVDALITDPPYCSGAMTEAGRTAAKSQGLSDNGVKQIGWFVGDNMGTAGLMFLLRSVMLEAQRLLKPNGSALLFCDWRMVPNIAPAVESCGFRFQNMIVWDKGSMGLGTGFRPQHEMILHFTNGSPEYSCRSVSNVIKCKRVTSAEREHPTQKPVDLLEQLVSVVCPPGGVVLDPFGGSGTTAVAAINTGRDAIIIERDAAHVATAWARVAEAIMQPQGAA